MRRVFDWHVLPPLVELRLWQTHLCCGYDTLEDMNGGGYMAQVVCDCCSSETFGVFTDNDEDYAVVCETCGTTWRELHDPAG